MGTEDERLKVESMVDKAAHLFDLGGDMSGEPSAALGMTGRFSLLVFFFSSYFFFGQPFTKNAQHAPLECERRFATILDASCYL